MKIKTSHYVATCPSTLPFLVERRGHDIYAQKLPHNHKTITNSHFKQYKNFNFIALIHPIQWTIANPVGADRPAKRQKKTSCVSTVPALCTRQVAHCTSFLTRQCDIIASFLFGACTVQTEFCVKSYFAEYCLNFENFIFLVIPKDS